MYYVLCNRNFKVNSIKIGLILETFSFKHTLYLFSIALMHETNTSAFLNQYIRYSILTVINDSLKSGKLTCQM